VKRTGVGIVAILAVTFILVAGSTQLGSEAHAQPPLGEVIILRCSISASVTSRPIVTAFDGSAAEPVVAQGALCAGALADLVQAGYMIDFVESAGGPHQTDLFYTLTHELVTQQ
jgi:hypothetical protein